MDLNKVRKAFGQSPRYRDNPKLLERNFQRLDADRDGSLTAEEFARVWEIEGQ